MALKNYRERRRFDKTPEPEGRASAPKDAGSLSFVIHKHAARRLHYDLRLEMGGTLKSWAVPKGPSLDPAEKRLAVNVEDHPLEYATFEGTIPKGQYGAGEVVIWDRGRWTPKGDPEAGYRKGELKFRLIGNKLHGDWVLVKLKGDAGGDKHENWLLIKEKDAEARPASQGDILSEEPYSVSSASLPGAKKSAFLRLAATELCSLVTKAPEGEEWLHEIKFDGYRILCELNHGKARLVTRGGNDWSKRFPSLVRAAQNLPAKDALIDGEVVMLEADGRSSFQALQNALDRKTDEGLLCYAFDLLYLDGYDLRAVPLLQRKKALERLLKEQQVIRFSDHVIGGGPRFYEQACRNGLEGIVSKRTDAPYCSTRTRDWVKVKCLQRQEFVIGGFTEPAGSRKGLGALLLGFHQNGHLVYAGRVGTGFTERSLKELRRKLDSLEQGSPPFVNPPKGAGAKGAHWAKPELVGEVNFREWTKDGILRQPSFQGLREDKPASDVVRESPAPISDIKEEKSMPTSAVPVVTSRRKKGAVEIGGISLTNPERVLFPEQGVTKLDLAQYYYDTRDWIMPHLADRPLMIRRCPEGHDKPCFYQKHANDTTPKTIGSVMIRDDDEQERPYLFVNSVEGLISLVQLGALEIHAWGARRDDVEKPDQITFDLDPDPAVPWERVAQAARDLREILESLGMTGFLKTSGGKGLHIVTPIVRRRGWDETREFSRAVAQTLASASPGEFILEASKTRRKDRIFIDYHRNGRGATAIVAYSTRARSGAPVAAPVSWSELNDTLRPDSFRLDNMAARLSGLKSDPWAGFFDARASITARMRKAVGLPG